MKKLFLAVGLLCLTLGVQAQQQETMKITKVKKGEEPKEVMDAINRDFPKAVVKDLAFLPAKLYGQEWNVQLDGDQIDRVAFYQVSIREEGKGDYTAVYDANGNLLSSRELIHDVSLPAAVSESLKKFKDWHVDKSYEIIWYHSKNVGCIPDKAAEGSRT